MKLSPIFKLLLAGKLAFCLCAAPLAAAAPQSEPVGCHAGQEAPDANLPQGAQPEGCCCSDAVVPAAEQAALVRSDLVTAIVVACERINADWHQDIAPAAQGPPGLAPRSSSSSRAPPIPA